MEKMDCRQKFQLCLLRYFKFNIFKLLGSLQSQLFFWKKTEDKITEEKGEEKIGQFKRKERLDSSGERKREEGGIEDKITEGKGEEKIRQLRRH